MKEKRSKLWFETIEIDYLIQYFVGNEKNNDGTYTSFVDTKYGKLFFVYEKVWADIWHEWYSVKEVKRFWERGVLMETE